MALPRVREYKKVMNKKKGKEKTSSWESEESLEQK
jgi:hypothetical protein